MLDTESQSKIIVEVFGAAMSAMKKMRNYNFMNTIMILKRNFRFSRKTRMN